MSQANVIIFTHPVDTHAYSVHYALRASGHRPILFDTSRVSSGNYLSADYSNDLTLTVGDFTGGIADVTASWNRRITREQVLPPYAHAADARLIRDSCNAVLSGMIGLLEEAFPVNPMGAVRVGSNKLHQLRAAQKVGFRTPRTLISNKYQEIRDFVASSSDTCVKGYYSHGWRTDRGIFHSITTRISTDDLSGPGPSEIMPHIYQEFIRKKTEYRLTMFGGYHATVAIDSMKLEGNAASDWRADVSYLSHLEPKALPHNVIDMARKLFDRLGLRFGTMDIAETDEGDFVFFEVNEQGQWLWKESHCPDCVILQPFCEYLASADDSFTWDCKRRSRELSVNDVFSELLNDTFYSSLLQQDQTSREGDAADERTAGAVAGGLDSFAGAAS